MTFLANLITNFLDGISSSTFLLNPDRNWFGSALFEFSGSTSSIGGFQGTSAHGHTDTDWFGHRYRFWYLCCLPFAITILDANAKIYKS